MALAKGLAKICGAKIVERDRLAHEARVDMTLRRMGFDFPESQTRERHYSFIPTIADWLADALYYLKHDDEFDHKFGKYQKKSR